MRPDDTLYTLITTDPAGEPIVTTNHTQRAVIRLALKLRSWGYGPVFEFKREHETPIPDAMLCPCNQPAIERQG